MQSSLAFAHHEGWQSVGFVLETGGSSARTRQLTPPDPMGKDDTERHSRFSSSPPLARRPRERLRSRLIPIPQTELATEETQADVETLGVHAKR